MKLYNNLFFILDTTDSPQTVQSLFYGYKFLQNDGFWISVEPVNDRIKIRTSTIAPCLVLYQTDSYWAISNSLYYLSNYLKEQNINLTPNETFIEFEKKTTTSFSYNYQDNITLYEELLITDLDYDFDIIDSKLVPIKKDFGFFKKDILSNKANLYNWYHKYLKLSTEVKDNLVCSLSGGLDSRLIWYLFCKRPETKLICWDAKPNVTVDTDKVLRNKVFDYFKLAYPESKKRHIRNKDTTKTQVNSELTSAPFLYGISYNPMPCAENRTSDPQYCMIGTASNVYRYELKDMLFVRGNIRRNWVQLFIARHYLENRVYVPAFLDPLLLELDPVETDWLHVILYNLFAPELLANNIPFTTKANEPPYFFQAKRANLFFKFNQIRGRLNEV